MNNDINNNINNNSQDSNTNLFPDSNTIEQPVPHEVLFETDTTNINNSLANQNNKNRKNSILKISLVIILIAIVSFGSYNLIIKINQSKNNSPTLPNEEENNKEDNQIKESLTNEELEELLTYIPFGVTNTKTVPYYNRNITVNDVDKTLLVNTALNGNYEFVECMNDTNCLPKEIINQHFVPYATCYKGKTCDPKGYDFYPLDKVNNNLKKMYNIDFNDLNIKQNTTWEYIDERIMYYNNGFLSKKTITAPDHVIHTIDKYEFNGDDLIIYDYPVKGFYYGDGLADFQNGNFVDYQIVDPQKEAQSKIAQDEKISSYVSQHKEAFTLFKYTYKKNDTGYYWYSSEVLSEPKKENIFTEYELQEYLNYVPFGSYDHSTLPYYNKISTVETVNKTMLVNMALKGTLEYIYCEELGNCLPDIAVNNGFEEDVRCGTTCKTSGYDFYPLDKVNVNLNKMYNINFSSLDIKEYDRWYSGGTEIMYYNNGFLPRQSGEFNDYVIHIIDKYEVSNNELIIYDYAIQGYYLMGSDAKDFLNGKIIPIESAFESKEAFNQYVSGYVSQHKSEYTEFKHTFKKNNMGYYWYSTEVVN